MKKIEKVLFLNPPDASLVKSRSSVGYVYFEPPLGLLYVYLYMKNRGDIDVKFIDLNVEMKFISTSDLDTILEILINDYKPNLIAITTLYYTDIPIFHSLAQTLKRIDPNVLVVFGGHYPTHLTEKSLSDDNVDFVVLSEGELGFSDLIDELNGKLKMEEVEGIAFKNDGKIVRNPRRTFWKEFSDVGRLPWEDTQFKYYFREGRNVLHRVMKKEDLKLAAITATRGCPNQCAFCSSPSFWSRRWRRRRISNIISEIKFLQDNYDVNTILFNDENIGVDKPWLLELLDELKKLKITWISAGGLSIRTLNDENVVQKMYESGIGLFNIAIESSSNAMLKKIKKPLTIEETDNVIKLIRKNGDAIIIGFFIIGFPFENLAGVHQTIQYAESLDLDWRGFYCFHPFPGCELFDYCESNKLMEDFDPNYGEVYYASKLRYIDYTAEQLNHLNYLANLKCNFVQNRNLRLITEQSLAQAERDFLYVLEMVRDHVFAFLGLAEVMRLRNQEDYRREYILKAKHIIEEKTFDWNYYLKELDIDIGKLYKEVA